MPPTNRFDLAGKTALVTGGTRGIGRAISFELARAGACVVVSSRKADAVAETVAALRAEGWRAEGHPANVGRPGDARALIDFVVRECDGLDVLVNNAAASPYYGPVADIPPEAFDKIIAVNVKAPWELGTLAYPLMVERGGGSVINISSIDGISPERGLGIYSVSKAALISLTKVMAQEWGAKNVRANTICPGLITTDFSAVLWKNEWLVEQALAQQPIQRLGVPEDVGSLALFLASEASSYCTGGVYMVDGGYLA
jgi:dehydrogenase/reductase SDR family protein 4